MPAYGSLHFDHWGLNIIKHAPYRIQLFHVISNGIFIDIGDEACVNDPGYRPAQAVFSYGPDLLELVGERWQQWSLGGALQAANPKGSH